MDTPLDAANLVDIQHFKTIITRRVEAFVYAYEVLGFVFDESVPRPSVKTCLDQALTRFIWNNQPSEATVTSLSIELYPKAKAVDSDSLPPLYVMNNTGYPELRFSLLHWKPQAFKLTRSKHWWSPTEV
jgi:hypothetical protein